MRRVFDGAFIISGIPGAGKTPVSRLLAEQLDNGVHIESDALQAWIRSGGVWPNEEPLDEAMRQLRLRTKNVCLLANSYREAGFTPEIDDVIIGSRLQDFLADLEVRPLRFVLLTPSKDVVRKARRRTRLQAGLLDLGPSRRRHAGGDAAGRPLAGHFGDERGRDRGHDPRPCGRSHHLKHRERVNSTDTMLSGQSG